MAYRENLVLVGEIYRHDDGNVNVRMNNENSVTISEFLEHKPSKAPRGIMQFKNSKLCTNETINFEAVDCEWGDVTSNGEEIPIDPWTICDLAGKHNFKSGFWFIFPETDDEADFAWDRICRGIAEEELGAVSKAECDVTSRKYTIRVNNHDYSDEEQVFSTGRLLRNAGINSKLMYKTDNLNRLVIYKENYHNLRPTIYDIMPNGDERNHLNIRVNPIPHINEYIMGPNNNELSLDDWRQRYPPSQLSRNAGICRIRVQRYHEMLNYKNMKLMRRNWREQIWDNLQFLHSTIDNLARKWQMKGGRWCFYVDFDKVDIFWKFVVNGFANGTLDNVAIMHAEVMPCDSDRHVIKVYNKDYTNTAEVYKLDKLIREIGVKCKMIYQPIIYSNVGIYSKNVQTHGFDSAIYHISYYNALNHKSNIDALIEFELSPTGWGRETIFEWGVVKRGVIVEGRG